MTGLENKNNTEDNAITKPNVEDEVICILISMFDYLIKIPGTTISRTILKHCFWIPPVTGIVNPNEKREPPMEDGISFKTGCG